MPRIKCTLPNAAEEIDGVAFSADISGSMTSEEVSDEVAERFTRIPGYTVADPKANPNKKVNPGKKGAAQGNGDPDVDEVDSGSGAPRQ